ncbi:MAG TPA: hypothetical protein VHB21_18095 [Minicystis sp.]|nr:hypothetical protein [Minicystis sp.]
MEAKPIGPLGVRAVGRGEEGGPAILLCHGFGAPGDDLVGLARGIDIRATQPQWRPGEGARGARWFFPEAPLVVDFGGGYTGRAWWPIDMERLMEARMRGESATLADETPQGLAPARAALEATIAELERAHGVTREQLVIGGFSQGAMLATEVALHADRPFAGLVALSGTVISRPRWEAAARARGKELRALVTHGRADPILPFEGGEMLRDLLAGAGADVTFVAHGGGHEIPAPALAALSRSASVWFSSPPR